tara:strand:+ start:908 stop:1213 length:306 start_codon:yes stop_codon:yes gene_type:complete
MLKAQQSIPDCLVPDCKNEAKTRGLCSTHYMYAHRLVTRGQTTWRELEAAGKCLGSHSNPSPTKDWFLNGVGNGHIQEVENDPIVVDENQQELDLDAKEEA